jgi:hypothetical protein
MEQEEYRGNIIHFVVEPSSTAPFWKASGYVVFYRARKLRSLQIEGSVDLFRSPEDAKQELLSIAKILIDRRLRS